MKTLFILFALLFSAQTFAQNETINGGLRVTGMGAGIARDDAGIEVDGTTSAGIALYGLQYGGTESWIWLGRRRILDGQPYKQASISSMWAEEDNNHAIGVLRLNAANVTNGTAIDDDVAIRIFGRHGIKVFGNSGNSDTDYPGANVLDILGTICLNNGAGMSNCTRNFNLVSNGYTVSRISRGANAYSAVQEYLTADVQDWLIGTREGDSNFRIYSFGRGADVLTIDRNSGQVRLPTYGAGTLTVGNDGVVSSSNALAAAIAAINTRLTAAGIP